ncbi:Matrix metalloproteinase-21, partial [Bos mutus]
QHWRYDSDEDQAHSEDERGRSYSVTDFRRIPSHPKSLDIAFYDQRKQFIYLFKGFFIIDFPVWCVCIDVNRNRVPDPYPVKITEVFP